MDVAGAYIASRHWTIREYLDQLARDEEHQLLDIPREFLDTLPSNHVHSIVATFWRSLQELDEGPLDILRMAALLSPAPVNEVLFAGVLMDTDKKELDSAKEVAALGLRICEKRSLTTHAGGHAWQFHALIRATVRWLEDATDRYAVLRQSACTILARVVHDIRTVQQEQERSDEITHAHFLKEGIDLTGDTITDPEVCLLFATAAILYYRADKQGTTAQLEAMHAIFTRVLGAEHPETLASLSNLASTLAELKRWEEAAEMSRRAWKGRGRALGERHPDTAGSAWGTSACLHQLGRTEEAGEVLRSLLWLADTPAEELPASIRPIRNRIIQLVGGTDDQLAPEEGV